jgi:hypothetical protein
MVISAFECWLCYKKGKQKKGVVRTLTVRASTARKIDCKKLPAVIISSTSFFIAGWTLFVTDIVIVTKAIMAYDFERT